MYCHNPDTIKLDGGNEIGIDELVDRAVKMKSYFGKKGGVTVSGGEPLLQAKALIPLFKSLQEKGIHTNIDTNGTVFTEASEQLIGQIADLVMFDVKHTSEENFKQLTGVKALSVLTKNIDLRERSEKPYWLRYVLVPGITDNEESLQWLISKFSGNKYMERLQILPYHKLGIHKWESLGWQYELDHVIEHTQVQIEQVQQKLAAHFKLVTIN